MVAITNSTTMPHFWFEQTGPDGEAIDVLVVRGTFEFVSDGCAMPLAKQQSPIALGDLFDGPVDTDPMRAVLREDGDLLPYKPGTDILVSGSASAPEGRPHRQWVAELRVGPIRKALQLQGPREYQRRLFGWRLGPAQPITSIALDYRLAYGGRIDIPAEFAVDRKPDVVKHSGNPAGLGWLPGAGELRRLPKPARKHIKKLISQQNSIPAPQIEAVADPTKNPYLAVPAQGFGPIARWWSPRRELQGIYDNEWERNRYPLLPRDFDSKFYQSAQPDMVAIPHLDGTESVCLMGLLPQKREMKLPGWRIIAVITRESGECFITLPLLDTVRFDLDCQQASMVWRMSFGTEDPVTEIALGVTGAAIGSEQDDQVNEVPAKVYV
jgi:hypothetical protein